MWRRHFHRRGSKYILAERLPGYCCYKDKATNGKSGHIVAGSTVRLRQHTVRQKLLFFFFVLQTLLDICCSMPRSYNVFFEELEKKSKTGTRSPNYVSIGFRHSISLNSNPQNIHSPKFGLKLRVSFRLPKCITKQKGSIDMVWHFSFLEQVSLFC